MRVTIAQEGVRPFEGWLVEENALTWDESVPVIAQITHGKPSPVIGQVTDIRREDDFSITAEIDMLHADELDFNVVMRQGEDSDIDQEQGIIKSAKIIQVFPYVVPAFNHFVGMAKLNKEKK